MSEEQDLAEKIASTLFDIGAGRMADRLEQKVAHPLAPEETHKEVGVAGWGFGLAVEAIRGVIKADANTEGA